MGTKYYGCQSAAIIAAEAIIREYGFQILYEGSIWTKQVSNGETVEYKFPLYDIKTASDSDNIVSIHKIVCIQLHKANVGGYTLNIMLYKPTE